LNVENVHSTCFCLFICGIMMYLCMCIIRRVHGVSPSRRVVVCAYIVNVYCKNGRASGRWCTQNVFRPRVSAAADEFFFLRNSLRNFILAHLIHTSQYDNGDM
jgi:hypothetical protein